MKLLVVTAVAAEAAAISAGERLREPLPGSGSPRAAGSAVGVRSSYTVAAVGVGPAAAAAGTARLLARDDYDGVISAGIAGGFDVPTGGVVIGQKAIAADLGAQTPDGFLSLDELGFGQSTMPATLSISVAGAILGDVLTVSTVTGTAGRAEELKLRHPEAVAEAMEGYGVACAAQDAGVPFAELRTISNAVGPRDKSAWRIGDALAALTDAFARLKLG